MQKGKGKRVVKERQDREKIQWKKESVQNFYVSYVAFISHNVDIKAKKKKYSTTGY